MSLNKGAALPAEPQGRWYKVISPKGADKTRGLFLADTFFGCWVHWEGMVLPCTHDEKCGRCKGGRGSRWQGYIAFYDMVAKERVVLSLTEMAARDCLQLMQEHGTLRGLQVETYRSTCSKNNARQVVKLVKAYPAEEVMPEHPVIDSLNRLWGMNLARLQGGEGKPRPFRPDDDNDGIPLPAPRPPQSPRTPATAEQRDRLKQVLGGIGGMPQ